MNGVFVAASSFSRERDVIVERAPCHARGSMRRTSRKRFFFGSFAEALWFDMNCFRLCAWKSTEKQLQKKQKGVAAYKKRNS